MQLLPPACNANGRSVNPHTCSGTRTPAMEWLDPATSYRTRLPHHSALPACLLACLLASVSPQFKPRPGPIMAPTRVDLGGARRRPLPAAAVAATPSNKLASAHSTRSGGGAGGKLVASPSGKLTKAEQRAEGQVSRAVYLSYFRCVRMGVMLHLPSPLPDVTFLVSIT